MSANHLHATTEHRNWKMTHSSDNKRKEFLNEKQQISPKSTFLRDCLVVWSFGCLAFLSVHTTLRLRFQLQDWETKKHLCCDGFRFPTRRNGNPWVSQQVSVYSRIGQSTALSFYWIYCINLRKINKQNKTNVFAEDVRCFGVVYLARLASPRSAEINTKMKKQRNSIGSTDMSTHMHVCIHALEIPGHTHAHWAL